MSIHPGLVLYFLQWRHMANLTFYFANENGERVRLKFISLALLVVRPL